MPFAAPPMPAPPTAPPMHGPMIPPRPGFGPPPSAPTGGQIASQPITMLCKELVAGAGMVRSAEEQNRLIAVVSAACQDQHAFVSPADKVLLQSQLETLRKVPISKDISEPANLK